MRVIAGTLRRRTLQAPPGLATRPTSDRLRETLFNVLAPRIEGARFLDLYAGSGAVGIEAVSRGAARSSVCGARRAGVQGAARQPGAAGTARWVRMEAVSVAAFLRKPEAGAPVSIVVFLDPPYDAADEYAAALGLLGGRPRTAAPTERW